MSFQSTNSGINGDSAWVSPKIGRTQNAKNIMKSLMNRLVNSLFRNLFKIPWVKARWAKNYRAVQEDETPWTPLKKPVEKSRIALITTAGFHLKTELPFDMADSEGDATFRVLPSSITPDHVQITHDYYDHRDADRDWNVVLPVDPLRELQAEGRIGSIGPNFYSFMGHIEGKHLERLLTESIPELVKRLKADQIDLALFSPA